MIRFTEHVSWSEPVFSKPFSATTDHFKSKIYCTWNINRNYCNSINWTYLNCVKRRAIPTTRLEYSNDCWDCFVNACCLSETQQWTAQGEETWSVISHRLTKRHAVSCDGEFWIVKRNKKLSKLEKKKTTKKVKAFERVKMV